MAVENRKQNILIVHNYYCIPGGEDTVVRNEKEMLESHGHSVFYYYRDNTEMDKMSLLRKFVLPFTAIFNPGTYFEVRKLIKSHKIEVVHVHNTLNLISPAVYYAALSMNIPVVQTVHNFRLLCPGAVFYREGHICEDCVENGLHCAVRHSCYRGSRVQTLVCVISMIVHRMTGIYGKLNYICLTEFNKEKILKLNQVKEERVFVKPNFTYDLDFDGKREEYYLYIGRIEEIKGISVLMEAFCRMPDKRLLLAGTSTEFDFYRAKAAEREIINLEFLGFKNKDELAKLLKSAKAVIVASQCYETFGMIVIEAFASHTPVIAGDVGNIGSLVEDGVNGIKFQYNSFRALIEAVEKFEQLDGNTLGENGYRKYQDMFSEKKNYENISTIYNDILNSR